uniref:Putative secreted protein n=1 Tax=Anopheles darlingi TaxID=43151 RepID=A0A2M4DJM5_ANODA
MTGKHHLPVQLLLAVVVVVVVAGDFFFSSGNGICRHTSVTHVCDGIASRLEPPKKGQTPLRPQLFIFTRAHCLCPGRWRRHPALDPRAPF